MIQPNYTEKALIPYSAHYAFQAQRLESLKHNLISDLKCTKLMRVCLFCKSRYKTYLFFLSLFFLLSTLACCLFFQRNDYGDLWSLKVINHFKQHGFTFLFIATNFSWALVYRLLSFFLSFSILAPIAAFICSCRVFFTSAFFYVVTIKRFTHSPIHTVLAYVLLNAAIVFADIIFFTESQKFYSATKTKDFKLATAWYCFFFAFYLCAVAVFLYQQLLIAVSVF